MDSNLIQNSISDIKTKSIIRFKYMPYSENIAKNVWLGIAKKIMNIEELEIHDDQKIAWTNLIKYVHGDETSIFDLEKSICIIGGTGSGKTKTMEIMSHYIEIDNVKYKRDDKVIPFNFRIFPSKEINNDYIKYGLDGIAKYLIAGNLCIDDLGSEPENSMHYGSRLSVLTEIIEHRYLKGLLTHFTTNLDMNQINEKYNSRVYSRIMHKCNIIEMNDRDFRIC